MELRHQINLLPYILWRTRITLRRLLRKCTDLQFQKAILAIPVSQILVCWVRLIKKISAPFFTSYFTSWLELRLAIFQDGLTRVSQPCMRKVRANLLG